MARPRLPGSWPWRCGVNSCGRVLRHAGPALMGTACIRIWPGLVRAVPVDGDFSLVGVAGAEQQRKNPVARGIHYPARRECLVVLVIFPVA